MNHKKFKNIGGKGYYIALILCAVAIGISGYLYSRNANPNKTSPGQPTGGDSTVPNIQAVATDPQDATQDPSSSTVKSIETVYPLEGETVMGYAVDCLSYNPTTRDWRTHDGIDIAAAEGTKVCSAADGTVYSVFEDDTMGKTVVIRHDGGYTTRYSSLASEVTVAPGQAVKRGETIGAVGTTALLENAIGDHLHFSVSCNGDSVDPHAFLNQE